MAKSKREEEAKALINRLNAEAGRVVCPLCSTPNWEVAHEPGKCPSQTVTVSTGKEKVH